MVDDLTYGSLTNYWPEVANPLTKYKQPLRTDGGAVGGDASNVFDVRLRPGVLPPSNQPFADHLQDLTQDYQDLHPGEAPTIVSGQRSQRDQVELRANYEAGLKGQPLPYPARGPVKLAALPGASPHQRGVAADVSVQHPGDLDRLAAEGWRGITPGSSFGDPGHYQASGGPGRAPSGPGTPSAGTKSEAGVADAKPAGGAPAATPSPAMSKSPMQALATLSLMQSLWPHLDLQPVNYNPFALMPKVTPT